MAAKRGAEERQESRPERPASPEDAWSLATLAVLEGRAKVAEAAETYGVSKDSIYLRLNRGTTTVKHGRPSLINEDMLEAIIAWIRRRSTGNNCPTTTEVIQGATLIASEAHSRAVTLSDSTKLRLLEVIKSRGINLSFGISTLAARTQANNVDNYMVYFDKLAALLKKFPILVKEPWRLCSLDESPSVYNAEKCRAIERVLFDPKLLRGQAPRREVIANGSSNPTLMCAICADGSRLPNAYFFKGKQMQLSWKSRPYPSCLNEDILNDVKFYPTPAGSVTQEKFSLYLREQLVPKLKERAPDGPLVLLFDAPSVHEVTPELSEFFKDKDVHWICFPAYSSHRLDPLDVLPFKELKKGIRKIVSSVATVYSNPAAVLDNALSLSIKSHAALEQDAKVRAAGFDNTLNTRNMFLMTETVFALNVISFTIREGFIKAGIHPFDPVSVLKHCRDWEAKKEEYMLNHSDNVRSSRSEMRSNVADDFTEIRAIMDDHASTLVSRMMRIKTIVDAACIPLNALEAAGKERDKGKGGKKAKRQLKVDGSPRSFPELEKALQERDDADATAAKAKQDAKAARTAAAASKAAPKASTAHGKDKDKGRNKNKDKSPEDVGPAEEPTAAARQHAPAPTAGHRRSAAMGSSAGAAGGAGAGAGQGRVPTPRPRARAALETSLASEATTAAANDVPPVRKATQATGPRKGGK